MKARIGPIRTKHSARGIPSYSLELWHDGLSKHRQIKGDSEHMVSMKAALQAADWEARWTDVSEKVKERKFKLAGKQHLEAQKSLAAQRTSEALAEIESLGQLLAKSITSDVSVDWETLKDVVTFGEPKPCVNQWPVEPQISADAAEPQKADSKYQVQLSLLDKIFKSRRDRRFAAMDQLLQADHIAWQQNRDTRRLQHKIAHESWRTECDMLQADLDDRLAKWEANRQDFLCAQAAKNSEVDARKFAYGNIEPSAVVEYLDMVLSKSQYPDYFPKEFEIDYIQETKTVVVDYALPAPEHMPTLKAVKYIAARDEFEDQHLPELQTTKLYDGVLYQAALRTMNELFSSDTAGAVDAAVVNGIVTATDRSTGKLVTSCVLSVQATKVEFLEINLSQVDPKTCFKALKGVAAAKLHGLSPIAPIMQMKREDSRFTEAYGVVQTLDEGVNLASMDWQDFEHLIREVFEKEFLSTGGEVRVTQASRDGGVDAVVFDPDPIRGGKIVIQAKRYTNTVNVSAVRDLYGTVMNEGATKGVLVTTSDYGPDSYSFANGKPLVLLNGANLLHMLQKHGHRARIDIREAKLVANGRALM